MKNKIFAALILIPNFLSIVFLIQSWSEGGLNNAKCRAYQSTYYDFLDGSTLIGYGDDMTASIYMPAIQPAFNFSFDGVPVTMIYVCTNGFIQFNSNSAGSSSSNLNWKPTNVSSLHLGIAPLVTDLNSAAYPASKILYKMIGKAPHRAIWIEWYNINFYYSMGFLNIQIGLFEDSNRIQIIYGPHDAGGKNSNNCFLTLLGNGVNYINIEPASKPSDFVFHTNTYLPSDSGYLYISNAGLTKLPSGLTIEINSFSTNDVLTNDGTLSDKEKLKIGKAYPNPANEKVIFDIYVIRPIDVKCYDLYGEQVYAVYIFNGSKMEIDISKLITGCYTVVVESGDERATEMFEVVK